MTLVEVSEFFAKPLGDHAFVWVSGVWEGRKKEALAPRPHVGGSGGDLSGHERDG